MANIVSATAMVVSKDKETIDKVIKIFKGEDNEFCLYGCYGDAFEIYEEDGFHIAMLDVSASYHIEGLFNGNEKKLDNGKQLTNLIFLSNHLGFGIEIYASEGGCGFAEHYSVNVNGELIYNETSEYAEKYPLDKNGEIDYEAEPTIECDFEMNDFSKPNEIYEG